MTAVDPNGPTTTDPAVDPNGPVNPNGPVENTNTSADPSTNAEGKVRKEHAKPVFELQFAGALPTPPKVQRTAPAGVTREMRFKDHLVQIQADPVTEAGDDGRWYLLADYGAPTTAKRTAKILTEAVNPPFETKGKDGEVLTHGGEMLELVNDQYTYQFVGQRHESDPTRSKLFARYVARAVIQPAQASPSGA